MSFVHQYWLVAPAFSPREFRLHWMDVTSLAGVGGLWVAYFLWQVAGPLTPLHDPMLKERWLMPEILPDRPRGPEHVVRYEKSDALIGRIVAFGIGLVVLGVVVELVAMWLFNTLRTAENHQQTPLSAVVREHPRQVPDDIPPPRLQESESLDLDLLRQREETQLTTYGWVDAKKGTVRIPIAEAMRLLADPKTAAARGIHVLARPKKTTVPPCRPEETHDPPWNLHTCGPSDLDSPGRGPTCAGAERHRHCAASEPTSPLEPGFPRRDRQERGTPRVFRTQTDRACPCPLPLSAPVLAGAQ